MTEAILKKKIQEDLKEALKSGQELNRSVLRLLLASIQQKEKEKRYKISKQEPNLQEQDLIDKSCLTDEEIIDAIFTEAKKRKDAIVEFEKGKREDLAEKERQELEIIKTYLPEQILEEELINLAKEAIEKTGAKEIKDMGKVMAELMPKVKGKADGSLVSKIIKEILSAN